MWRRALMTKIRGNPAEKILAYLDDGAEIENFAPSEIEMLPISDIEERLQQLGVNANLPDFIEGIRRTQFSPAHKVIDCLDAEDWPDDHDIEHMSAAQVTAKLNETGLNHV